MLIADYSMQRYC